MFKLFAPKVCVVIVNFKNADLLKLCLDSLCKSNYPNYEIAIVDCLTSPKKLEEIKNKFPQTKIIHFNKDIGASASHNVGVRFCSKDCKYIVFLDNDAIVESSTITEMVKFMEEHPWIGAAQPIILNKDGSIQSLGLFVGPTIIPIFLLQNNDPISSSKDLILITSRPRKIRFIAYPTGACFITRREVFERSNGYDPVLWLYHDDLDYGLRLWSMGYPISLIPTAKVIHLGSTTVKKNPERLKYFVFRNNTIVLFKIYPITKALIYLLMLVFIILPRILYRHAIRREFCIMKAIIKGLVDGLKYTKYSSLQRSKIQCARRFNRLYYVINYIKPYYVSILIPILPRILEPEQRLYQKFINRNK